MGTRHFLMREEKDSNISWEKADKDMEYKLIHAINKNEKPGLAKMIVMIAMTSFVIQFLVLYFTTFLKENPPLMFSIFYLFVCFIFLFALLYGIIQPIFFPLKQREVWYFKSKCYDMDMYYAGSSNDIYHAYFQKGGKHLALRITSFECKEKIPLEQEYIFYKFHNSKYKIFHSTNRWTAIPSSLLDDSNSLTKYNGNSHEE